MNFSRVFLLEVLIAALLGTATIYFLRRRRTQYATGKAIADSTPIGSELAQQIAELLEQGLQICLRHRDYCGMGLRYREGIFLYGEVIDGELPADDKHEAFTSREAFASWLATQSNCTLHGDGNQRLTRERLDGVPRSGV